MKKNCKKQINENLEQLKLLGGKVMNYILNGKVMIIHLTQELVKMILLYKNKLLPYLNLIIRVETEQNLNQICSNYAAKSDLKKRNGCREIAIS